MGTLRFYLAVCVLIWHCWLNPDRHFLGSFAAVYCFFIMSGFYISMTLAKAIMPQVEREWAGQILTSAANRQTDRRQEGFKGHQSIE